MTDAVPMTRSQFGDSAVKVDLSQRIPPLTAEEKRNIAENLRKYDAEDLFEMVGLEPPC